MKSLREQRDRIPWDNKKDNEVRKGFHRLINTLSREGDKFFDNSELTQEKLERFDQKCQKAMELAKKQVGKQYGWNSIHPLFKAVLGILAFITGVPAVVIKAKYGFRKTFFKKPEPSEASKQLEKHEEELTKQIKSFVAKANEEEEPKTTNKP